MKSKYILIGLTVCSLVLVLILVLAFVSRTHVCTPEMIRHFEYPKARRDETVVDDFHGTKVTDPYRWLEDPDSEETKQFVDAENEVTRPFLKNCGQWKNINEKLRSLWNYPKFNVPDRRGKYYFSYMNTGLQNQSVLYKQDSLNSERTVFFDPNTLSTDGTVSLGGGSFSEDGKLWAYGLSESGSDWIKIKVRDVETGKDFADLLEEVKFSSMSWTHDNKGFFYSRFPYQKGKNVGSENVINEHQKLYYHRIGDPQSRDVLVAEFTEHSLWLMSVKVTHCSNYLILSIFKGSENRLYFAELKKNGEINGKLSFTPIVDKFEAYYSYITNTGTKFIFYTNKDAPNYRLISIDLNNGRQTNWDTLIAEHKKDVLDWAQLVDNDKIMLHYLHDVTSVLQVNALESGTLIRRFPLEHGQIYSFHGSRKYSEIFYQFDSFLTPDTIYRYDFSKPEVEPIVLRETKLNWEGFDKNNFDVEQVFYSSKDGTKIPMFIVQKKKSGKKGPKPCLLYGYGGFGISMQPTFSDIWLFFIDKFDGILALPNIRGGGEYGEKWYDSGRLLNKQNSFDDFQAAAEYLVQNNYSESKKIAIRGSSNGGLLVGACMNQRPDLFGAAIAQVGVMDMLRFHKFTIGHAWISDYGNPDEKVQFENLYKFSPLHNVRSPNSTKQQYPSTLILTADHDDRVSPLHSLKFTAALHHAIKDNPYQKNPVLLRVYSKAGHGAGKPTAKRIEEETDILSFLYQTLQIDATI